MSFLERQRFNDHSDSFWCLIPEELIDRDLVLTISLTVLWNDAEYSLSSHFAFLLSSHFLKKDLSESLHLTSFSHFWFYHHLRFFVSFLTLENNTNHLMLACCWSSPWGHGLAHAVHLYTRKIKLDSQEGLGTLPGSEIQHCVLYSGRRVSLLGKAIC